MSKSMSVREARANFSDVLGMVYYGKVPVTIERKGKPVAVLINPDLWDRLQELAKQRFFEVVDEIRRDNADKDPDEVYRDVTAVVEEVRRELYEQQRTATHRG